MVCVYIFYVYESFLHINLRIWSLELIDEVIEGGDTFLKTLSLSNVKDDFVGLGGGIKGITVNFGPMGEDTLRESLTSGKGSQVSSET